MELLERVNSIPDVTIATAHSHQEVAAGRLLVGCHPPRCPTSLALPCLMNLLPCGMLCHAWQLSRLASTLNHAATNTTYYRKALVPCILPQNTFIPADVADITPDASRRMRESLAAILHSLSFNLPEDLAKHPESFLAVGQDDVAGVISLPTSGTTGPGKRIFCTQADLAETIAFFNHGMRFMVAREHGGSVALLMSGERQGSVGRGCHHHAHPRGDAPYPLPHRRRGQNGYERPHVLIAVGSWIQRGSI